MIKDFLDPAFLRPAVFFGGLVLLLVFERLLPRRISDMHRRLRWPANLALVALSTALLALLPVAAIGTAFFARTEGIGLFNNVSLPGWTEIALAWLLLDLGIYWQHRWMHEVPWLWRLHRVHHSDMEFDTTTGVRFHPLEILLSMFWKMSLVLALGANPLAVLALEITLNAFALFNHANLRLPGDRFLRKLVVTPDMHRVHHSIHPQETNSNYGSSLPLWDHLFASYIAQPREGHVQMRIGIARYRETARLTFPSLLMQPFRN